MNNCATVHTVKSKRKISQNFVAFSEYMNFNLIFFFKTSSSFSNKRLLICTLIFENQGLEKSRPISNPRKISGSANLDFFFNKGGQNWKVLAAGPHLNLLLKFYIEMFLFHLLFWTVAPWNMPQKNPGVQSKSEFQYTFSGIALH